MGNTTSTTGGWSTPSEPPAKTSGEPEFVGGRWTTGGGAPTLNAWGFTMDDLLLLPLLRNLTCCKAIEWPPTARAYVEQVEALGVATYFAHAI